MTKNFVRKNIWFEPETWKETKTESMDRGQSPSEFINDLLEEYLEDNQPQRTETK